MAKSYVKWRNLKEILQEMIGNDVLTMFVEQFEKL